MGPHRSVLVVDDDPDIRETLTEVLVEEGFEVTTAPNGRAALEALEGGLAPTLILLDMMMPIMDGGQFREQQLKAPALAKIPVIVLSAHANTRELVEKTRTTNVLKKPLRLKDLVSALSAVLGPPALAGGFAR